MLAASYEFQLSKLYLLLFTLKSPWVVDFIYFFPVYVAVICGRVGKFVTSNRAIICGFSTALISVLFIILPSFHLFWIQFTLYFSFFLLEAGT